MDTGRCKDLQAKCDGAVSLLRDARDNGCRVHDICETLVEVLIMARENLRSQNIELEDVKRRLRQSYYDIHSESIP